MLPKLNTRNGPSMGSMTTRRKEIRSPKTDKDFTTEILNNNLSPRQKFKPIDFRENVVISINSSEPMRTKEYQKLCDIVTKFEHKKLKEKLRNSNPPKEFGFYAKKKGYTIKTKTENLENRDLIEKLKSKSSMGIVQYDYKKQSKVSWKNRKANPCFSQSPKIRVDSDGDTITADVGLATTDFFKKLVIGNRKEEVEAIKLNSLDPNQKKDMYNKISCQKHYMLPSEMTQLKKALRKEDILNSGQSEFLIQDFSNIQGKMVEYESFRGHQLRMSENKKLSKSITFNNIPNKAQKEAYSHLTPRLKEILMANKDTLSKF